MLVHRGLGWMHGFPRADGWVVLPGGERIQIDRSNLRRASSSMNKLRREFPRALPSLVGDVDAWILLHRSLLEVLKPFVHDGAGLSLSALDLHPAYRKSTKTFVARAYKNYPELRTTLSAFSWMHWLQPEKLRSCITWVIAHREEVAGVFANFGEGNGSVALAQLWILMEVQGKSRIEPLLVWLATPNLTSVSVEQGQSFANQAQQALDTTKQKKMPQQPSTQLGSEALPWLCWLTQQDRGTARRSLELFGVLHTSVQANDWRLWWSRVQKLIARAQALPEPPRRRHPIAQKRQAIRAKLRGLGESTPPVVPAKALFSLLREEALPEHKVQYKTIYKVLQRLPVVLDETPIRLAFLRHWNALRLQLDSSKNKRFGILLNEFSAFLRDQDDVVVALRPWQPIWAGQRHGGRLRSAQFCVDTEMLDELVTRAQIETTFAALKLLSADTRFQNITDDDAETLVDVVLATKTSEDAATALGCLKEEGLVEGYLPQSVLALAAVISETELIDFGRVTKVLLAIADDVDDLENTGKRLLYYWKNIPTEHLRRSVLDGQCMALCRATMKAEVIRQGGGRVPLPMTRKRVKGTRTWMQRFSESLHEALRVLDACDDNAEMTAGRILKKDFPDPSKTRKQIVALQRRKSDLVQDEALEVRIDKLKSWLVRGKPLGVGRLANLSRKLEAAATRALVANWSARVDEEFLGQVPRFLRTGSIPPWASDFKVLELFLPIGGLTREFRTLVSDLLERRCGAPPWDLRDRGKNKQFLGKMGRRNINVVPWMDEAPVLTKTHHEHVITFTLERDPLEVFRMGGHFKTCLSPGAFNYFSVFANAGDVNKQVLYGRREDGTVIARCLLALSDEGGIVTFHPYSHDKGLKFRTVLKRYVLQLAKEMNTIVLGGGTVSTLVSPDWYDDGSIDVVGRFAFLQDRGFLDSLSSVALGDVVSMMQAALAPLTLNELTLPLFLNLDVFTSRPELIRPLYPLVVHSERLEPWHLLRVVDLLIACKEGGLIARLSPRLTKLAMYAHRNWDAGSVARVVEALAVASPSQALSILRKTRPQGVRTWSQEDSHRLYAGALANWTLHRPKQAERLLLAALNNPCCGGSKLQCEELLQKISE